MGAAEINGQIRELWADGSLRLEEQEVYHRLLVEWAAAVRAEQELAA
ncbi:hypothetical protein [Streptomyces sp. NPDC046161]